MSNVTNIKTIKNKATVAIRDLFKAKADLTWSKEQVKEWVADEEIFACVVEKLNALDAVFAKNVYDYTKELCNLMSKEGVDSFFINAHKELCEEKVEQVQLVPGAEPVLLTSEDKVALETLINSLSGQIEAAKAAWGEDAKVMDAITNTANAVQQMIVSDQVATPGDVQVAFIAALQAEKVIKKLVETKQKEEQKAAEAEAALKAQAEEQRKAQEERKNNAVAVVEKLKASITDNGRKTQVLEDLSFAEFALISDYPYNRDAKKRAESKSKTHLHGAITSHNQLDFAIVVLDKAVNADLWAKVEEEAAVSGEPCTLPYMKVDGHSRTAAINAGNLDAPEEILVKVHKEKDFSDSQVWDLVEVYCSPASDETTAEKTYKANKVTGLDVALSTKFALNSWKTAFGLLGIKSEEKGREVFKDAFLFADTLKVPDSFKAGDVNKTLTASGVKAGLLASFLLAGDADEEEITEDAVKSFWVDFFSPFATSEEKHNESKEVSALKIWMQSPKSATGEAIPAHGGTFDKALKEQCEKQIRLYAKRLAKKAK